MFGPSVTGIRHTKTRYRIRVHSDGFFKANKTLADRHSVESTTEKKTSDLSVSTVQ